MMKTYQARARKRSEFTTEKTLLEGNGPIENTTQPKINNNDENVCKTVTIYMQCCELAESTMCPLCILERNKERLAELNEIHGT